MPGQDIDTTDKGSELGEALALSHDTPMRVAEYRLDWTDALAWESLPREMQGWRKVVMVLWLAGAGVVLALLPETVAGSEGTVHYYAMLAGLLAVQYAVATIALFGLRHLRARRRFPRPVQVRLEFWGDHLVEHRSDFAAAQVIVPEYCGRFIATSRHMFVPYLRHHILIVPVAAFDSADDLRAEAAAYEQLWAEMRQEM